MFSRGDAVIIVEGLIYRDVLGQPLPVGTYRVSTVMKCSLVLGCHTERDVLWLVRMDNRPTNAEMHDGQRPEYYDVWIDEKFTANV